MIRIHDRDLRGRTQAGWLDGRHTFSFGGFRDPHRMGFRSLRVINDDRVIPGAGFDTHPHRDMEIITYILEGELAHKDSLGSAETIARGEIQRMTAGTGVTHSEFNPSRENGVHLLQIWILPERHGLEPSYEQKLLTPGDGEFRLIGDRQGTDGAITIHQDVRLLAARIDDGRTADYAFERGRAGFIHVARGQVELDGEILKEGDGVEISDIESVILTGRADGSELLLFDLA